jgi:tellurite resistance-related uncharacterized protein
MKKILRTTIALFALFILVGCKKDKVKPVITVPAAEVSIYVGDEFDPMKNVVAKDDVDGVLTSEIVVTGSVDTTKEGSYTLVYTVKDKAGNEGKKEVTVHVIARPQGLGIENPDFDEWDEERGMPVGWTNWVNTSQDVAATFSHGDSMAIIDITAQSTVKDNNWWDVQFRCETVTFPAFESYTLRIWAYAENPRYMMVNIQGGGLAQKAIDAELVELGTEVPTEPIEIDFFGLQDANNAMLQFNLGTFHKVTDTHPDKQTVLGKVYFLKVEVVSGPEIENQAPLLTGSDVYLSLGGEALVKQGIVVKDDRDNLTLDDVTAEALGEELDVNKEGVYEYKYTVKDSEGLETTMTRKFVVGSFIVPTMDKWTQWSGDGGEQTVTAAPGSKEASIEITALGPNAWHNQFKLTNLKGNKGTYEIRFKASSTVARTIVFALESNYGVGVPRVWHRLELTPELKEYVFELVLPEDALEAGSFQFFMGNCAHEEGFEDGVYVPSTIAIKDFKVLRLADIPIPFNILTMDLWTEWSGDGGTQVVTAAEGSKEASIEITALGPNAWHNQFKLTGLKASRGRYILSFQASSTVARTIAFALESNFGIGVPRVWHRLELTPELQEFEFELILPTDAVDAGSFQFFMGDCSGATGFEDGVYVPSTIVIKDFKAPRVGDVPIPQEVPTMDLWTKWSGDGGTQTVTAAEGSKEASIEITALGPNAWHNQFKLTNVTPKEGKYEIKFQASSTVARTIVFALESNFGVGVPRVWHRVELTPELKEYKFELILPADATAGGSYQFFMGNCAHETGFEDGVYVPSTIVIKNFTVTRVSAAPIKQEIPTMDLWTEWSGDGGTQVVTAEEGATEASIEITALGPNAWHNQFKLTGLKPKAGSYTITFKASSTEARTIVFALENNFGVGVPRVWHRVELTSELQEFTFELVLPADATEPGSFQFFLGKAAHEEGFEDGTYVISTIVIKDFTFTKNP